jgi:hypothetical protein
MQINVGDGADTTATHARALLLEGTQAADPSCVMCGFSTPLTAPGRWSYSRRASGTCLRSLQSALSSRYTPGLARSAGCAACALRGHRCLKCALAQPYVISLLVQAPVFFVDSDGTHQQTTPKLAAAACAQSPPPPPPPDPCPACVTPQEFGVCTAAINAVCCAGSSADCSLGEHTVCNAGCAAVLVPANRWVPKLAGLSQRLRYSPTVVVGQEMPSRVFKQSHNGWAKGASEPGGGELPRACSRARARARARPCPQL